MHPQAGTRPRYVTRQMERHVVSHCHSKSRWHQTGHLQSSVTVAASLANNVDYSTGGSSSIILQFEYILRINGFSDGVTWTSARCITKRCPVFFLFKGSCKLGLTYLYGNQFPVLRQTWKRRTLVTLCDWTCTRRDYGASDHTLPNFRMLVGPKVFNENFHASDA